MSLYLLVSIMILFQRLNFQQEANEVWKKSFMIDEVKNNNWIYYLLK